MGWGSVLDTAGKTGGAAAVGGFDPMSAAMLSAGSNVLGKMLSPTGDTSRADSSANINIDHSGWAVTFGSGDASTSAGMSQWLLGGLIVLGMLIAYRATR